MTSLAPSYTPGTFEPRIYAQWEASGAFVPQGDGPAYTILLPPPNVTGTLHMGHAFQLTLQDALIRYHRMLGYRTLWQVGSDHAGIATEMVVSRNLALSGSADTRDSLGREKFIEKIWEWKQHSGDTIERQMRRLGASGDWSRKVFTMDPQPSAAVIEAFVRLYEKGLIYRGKRLVNWDPVLQTAVSDLEVVSEEENGFLWEIRYPLAGGAQYEHIETDADGHTTLRETRDYLVVATTRPETLLGDTAVMVHPDDPRYQTLIGKRVKLPLTDREVPIIADTYVDRDFGTGVVKVTPAHDFNDWQVGQRHNLPVINLFTDTATLNDNAPERFRGLDRFAARKAVLTELENEQLLLETKPHLLQVPRGDRSGQIIEPYLTDQWFVRMDALGKRGLELVENGSIRFVPPNWINTYRHWMENIQDWTISRQLWWGHRIPAWFDDNGTIYVGRNEAEIRAQHHLPNTLVLTQDSDVLETWFSSALWPFSTMGWPDATAMRERGFSGFVPSSVLVTGFDIIFFWVARMVMMTDTLTGQIPFHEVYITGLVRDRDGQKMSKSKGNILDPLDIIDGISIDALVEKRTTGLMKPKEAPRIEKATRKEFPSGITAFGADPLRLTMAALAGPGRDIKFDLGRADGYKNFCNKLWNAARFVLLHTDGFQPPADHSPASDTERWILARLNTTILKAREHFSNYRFDLLVQTLYEFTWNEYCDWFVELAKPALTGEDTENANNIRHTLLHVLETTLRLLHPLIPFVTEELWQQVAPRLGISADTISLQPYPDAIDTCDYAQSETDIEWLKQLISAVRRIRSELGVSPARQITLLTQGGDSATGKRLRQFDSALKFLAKLEKMTPFDGAPPASATARIGDLDVFVPLEGLVDLNAERARLDKEIIRIEAERNKSRSKLEKFTAHVPAAVVAQERQRLADWSAQHQTLTIQRKRLG